MLIPVIRIRDKRTGNIHIVGTNYHDSLNIYKDRLTYVNMQNGCGSQYDDAEYEFVHEENDFGYYCVEMVTLEQWIGLAINSMKEQADDSQKLYKLLMEDIDKKYPDAKKIHAGDVYE